MKSIRVLSFVFAIGIAVLFAVLLAGPVHAQDDAPPAPQATPAAAATETPANAPAADSVPPDAASTQAPAVDPTAVEPAPTDAVQPDAPVMDTSQVSAEDPTPVAEAPELVPLGDNGVVLPMASQAAADVMAEPDPWFACTIDDFDGLVDGKCSYTGANSLNNALAGYVAKGGSGAIFMEATTHTVSGNVTVNGALLPGLTGIMADIGGSSANVNLNLGTYYLTVTGTTAGFTLQGMNIYGSNVNPLVYFNSNTGNLALTDLVIKNNNVNGDGLQVINQTGNVTLNSVRSDLNGDEGANITGVTGNVVINNSSFDSNGQGGGSSSKNSLNVQANGSITLNGVSSSNFVRGNGAALESQKSVTVKNSLFNNNNDSGGANNGWGLGLYIPQTSKGPVLLDHVGANGNAGEWGIFIRTTVGGAITLNTVEATLNRFGILIDNCWNTGSGCTTSAGSVSLTNITLVNPNASPYGNPFGNLNVLANGAITGNTIKSAYANSAGFGGIVLDNSVATSVSAVNLNNVTNNYNNGNGVLINSRGAVTLNHVESYNNYYGTTNGIEINTPGAVSILSTLGTNWADNNYGYGLVINSSGAIVVNDLNATYNPSGNLRINNTPGTGSVTVSRGTFDQSSSGNGVYIRSRGAITLTDVTAANNLVDGINLDNSTAPSAQPVAIKSSTSSSNNIISYNHGYGLFVQSKGNISVSDIYDYNSATYQGNVLLDNTFGTGTVSMAHSQVYSANDPANVGAVYIKSKGTVSVSTSDINNNYDSGLVIDNTFSSGTPGVTSADSQTNYNSNTGLLINSKGAVKLTNFEADSTSAGEAGAKIVTSGSVSIGSAGSYSNAFDNNFGNGLMINAGGSVSIKDVTAYGNNTGYGVTISSGATVTVINGDFYSNASSTGLDVLSSGSITLTNISAYSNFIDGVRLDNSSGSAGVTVNILPSGFNYFYSNGVANMAILTNGAVSLSYLNSYGSPKALDLPLFVGDVTLNHVTFYNTSGNAAAIYSKGTVTGTNINTQSTSGSGLLIDNTWGSSPKAVTVTTFYDHSTTGTYALYIKSNGAITVTDVDVNGGNTRDYGIYLDNTGSSLKAPVTIKKPSDPYDANTAYYFDVAGIYILSHGLVTMDKLGIYYNASGAVVNTDTAGATVTNSYFQNNTDGLNIVAGGPITLTSVTADYNNGAGVTLKNDSMPAAVVTITTLDVSDNDTTGLKINSAGAVTITNLDASSMDLSGSLGVDITTTGAVTIGYTGSNSNYLYYGQGSGGMISAGGNVSLKRIVSTYNVTGYGFDVSTSGGSISISDSSFYSNHTFGLHAVITAGSGSITLTNVDANNNATSYGVTLDNSGGTGGITVNGSSIHSSQLTGNFTTNLDINTHGPVTLNYVDASNAPTAIKFPTIGNPVGNVSMTYVKVDYVTAAYGLQFESNGTVSLSHISAQYDNGGGVYIENSNAISPQNVTLLDINALGSAGQYGLWVHSKGVISAKDLYLYDSGSRLYGAKLDNSVSGATGGVTVGSTSSSYNNFNNPTNEGLLILSNGAVSVSNVSSNTTGKGVSINNQGIGLSGTGAVTLTNVFVYSSVNSGIEIRTNGNTTLNNVESNYNGTGGTGMGVDIQVGLSSGGTSGTVSLTNVTAYSNKNDEISIQSLRQVTLKNVDVYDYSYSGRGVYINTTGGVSILDPGGSDWNSISDNPGTNLLITAGGDVVLQKIQSSGSDTGYGVQVTTTGKATITNLYTNYNHFDGLNVVAGGAINLSWGDLNSDQLSDARLVNTGGGSAVGVTVTNSKFNGSSGASPNGGLLITTDGPVLLSQVTTTGHSSYGAYITINSPSAASVTISKSVFSDNNSEGLHVTSSGNVTMNGITGFSNSGANGVYINNSTGAGSVTILATLGANSFNENSNTGLSIVSKGAVTLNNVTANYNYNIFGIQINNSGAAAGVGKVTITGLITDHNGQDGINISSNGIVTVSNAEIISNGLSGSGHTGIYIASTNGYNATVQNSVISGNGKNGIFAGLGGGTLTVKKTFYMGNNQIIPTDGDKNIEPNGNPLFIIP